MRRIAFLLAVSLFMVSCATTQPTAEDSLLRAVNALGGPEVLRGVKTVRIKGTVRQWEPEQSVVPGGEMRLANDATFDSVNDVDKNYTRTDWVRKFAYPWPRTFTFIEIVTTQVGFVSGIDSNGRTRQSLDSNPPGHTMSALRLATAQRELQRASALLLLDMYRNPAAVYSVPNETAGGVSYPTVEYRVGPPDASAPAVTTTGDLWCQGAYQPVPRINSNGNCPQPPATAAVYLRVMFDPATGLPSRIRTHDYDHVWGDVTYDLVLADWKTFDGVKVATDRKYELNGRTVTELKVTEAKMNAPVAVERFGIPADFVTDSPKLATGPVPYQWVIRRQFIGTYLDSDVPSYDTRGSKGLQLVELASGVLHQTGGSHNSLIVEMRDHLIVFDAPVNDWQSNWVLGQLKTRYPHKPVKYLVLNHHHMDHIGGLRAYVAQGAALVVAKGAGVHYRRLLAAPFTRNPDVASKDLSKTKIIEVADKQVFSDGSRQVEVYVIENPHAASMLIGYIPQARLGFVTDIWSPGAGPLPDRLNPDVPQHAWMRALVVGVKKAGITPSKFAGGHGSTADFQPLVDLEAK